MKDRPYHNDSSGTIWRDKEHVIRFPVSLPNVELIASLLNDAYQAGVESVTPTWLPMDSAPKDGTRILVKHEDKTGVDSPVIVYYHSCQYYKAWVVADRDADDQGVVPISWMPLPKP